MNRFVVREVFEESTFDPDYDMLEKVADVECEWTSYAKIGGKTMWDIKTMLPPALVDCDRKLPSDSVYREDLIHWNLEDEINGQVGGVGRSLLSF